MHRRTALLLAFLLASCRRSRRTFEEVLPVEVSGGWRRSELRKPNSLPPLAAQLGVEEAVEATYVGSGSIQVRAYRMKAETSAFELMQKWRQADGMAAYQGAYFFVAQPSGVDPGMVMAFLSELRRTNNVA